MFKPTDLLSPHRKTDQDRTGRNEMASLNVFAVGASRNIGYYSSIRLLDAGATVTFLLRNPSVFDGDETIQKYVKSGKAKLVKGDALVQHDVEAAWTAAASASHVDLVLFTLGFSGIPGFSLTKGMTISPTNLVTQSFFNVVCTLWKATGASPALQPRLVTISSIGLTKTSHKTLPFVLKPLYGYFLQGPHKDKVGAERLVSHCAGWEWNSDMDGEPDAEIMGGDDWKDRENLPGAGDLKHVLVIRPALLTNGECVADKPERKPEVGPYRVSAEELCGTFTISRKDVAHFAVDAVLNKWEEYENKVVSIAY